MDLDNVIDTLNDLIETCKDGEHGFLECAENVKNGELKLIFTTGAQRCAEAAAELQSQVARLGGSPQRTGSLAGSAHRRWVDVKSLIMGRDERSVLAECERGEDVAKSRYETALQKDMPEPVRAIIERQYRGVLQNHDRVRALERNVKPT